METASASRLPRSRRAAAQLKGRPAGEYGSSEELANVRNRNSNEVLQYSGDLDLGEELCGGVHPAAYFSRPGAGGRPYTSDDGSKIERPFRARKGFEGENSSEDFDALRRTRPRFVRRTKSNL